MSGNSYESCHDGNLMSLFIHGKLKSLILACCIGPGELDINECLIQIF